MKSKIFLFFMVSFLIFPDKLIILDNQLSILKEKYKELEVKKDFFFSEIDFLNLQKEIYMKEIEINQYIFELTSKENSLKSENEKYNNLKLHSQIKVERIKKILAQAKINNLSITQTDLNDLEIELLDEENNIMEYEYRSFYSLYLLSNLEKIDNKYKKFNTISSLIEEKGKILTDLGERKLNLLDISKASKKDKEYAQLEFEIVTHEIKDEKLKNEELIMKVKLEIDNYSNRINILNKKIKIKEENNLLYEKEVYNGYFTIMDLVEKDLELLNMKKEKMEIETELKNNMLYLKLLVGE